MMARIYILIVVLGLISGCNNKKETSPFDEIFSKPPFASISDSIEKQPGRDDLYFRRAVLLNSNELLEPALADFRKAWSIKKEEKYAFGISVILLEKNPDSAIAFLDRTMRDLPESILLGLSLARAYEAQNRIENALRVTDDLLKENPEQVDVMKMKASLLEKKGNTNDAIALMEKAYSITPYDIELNYMLAFSYGETKNPRVLALCDSLIQMDSLGLHAEPYYYKGLYYSNTNQKPKALDLFNEAIRHDYNFLDAHIEKGITLYEQKKFKEAYQAFNLAMTISPKYADAYYWMGKSQQAMGDLKEARLNYQRAFGLDNTLVQAKQAADSIRN